MIYRVRLTWTVERVLEVEADNPAQAAQLAVMSDEAGLADAIEWGRVSDPLPYILPPQKCGDVYDDGDHRYRCTLDERHEGDHVMLTHPMQPTWRG